MKKTKSQVKHCVSRLRVLADETRLRVLHEIMHKPMTVTEINQVLKIDQSLLSHHLKILRDSGLVTSDRQGKTVVYQTSSSVVLSLTEQSVDLGCCQLNFTNQTKTQEKSS